MVKIKYRIEIPENGVHLLGNIYSPAREDLQPFEVRDVNEEDNPLCWSHEKYMNDFVRKTTDDPDIQDILMEDYWTNGKKFRRARETGKIHIHKPPFHKNATDKEEISGELFGSDSAVNEILRKHLLGPVGVVVKTYKHDVPTGKKIGPDDEPTLGFEKGTLRYLRDGTPLDSRRIYVHTYYHIYVPSWIGEEVQECIDSEPDENGRYALNCEMDSESLGVLKYIFEKTAELRERFPKMRDHYLNETAISNATGFSKSLVKRAVRDTVGILAEAIIEKNKIKYHRKTFLPECREDLAQYLLYGSDELFDPMAEFEV